MSARDPSGETPNGTNDPGLIKAFGGNDIVNARDAADDSRRRSLSPVDAFDLCNRSAEGSMRIPS